MPDRRRKPTVSDFAPALKLEGRRVAVDPESRRIAVRVANFGETHSGFGPMVQVPRNVNVDAAHVGVAELDSGESLRVATLPMHTTHAPTDLQAMHAASWYENTGTAVARGRYSVDDQGVRFDGLLFDDVEESTIDRLTAGSASGDWRSAVAIKRFEDFEHTPCDFVGSCVVNIPGFSDTFRQAPSERFALAASAHSILSIENEGTTVDEDETTTPADETKPDETTEPATTDADEDTAPEPTVTLKASALKELVEVAKGVDDADTIAAIDEATQVLTAGGFIAAPDPQAQRLEMLERIVIDLAFNTDD